MKGAEVAQVPDFIEVIDGALDAALCRELIDTFETSPHRRPGRTGGGVDTSKKISTDLPMSDHPQYRELIHRISAATSRHLVDYFRRHHFALIAPLALTVRNPANGQPTPLTDDNWPQLGEPKAAEFMQTLYRLGALQAQKYDKGVGNYAYWHCEVYPQAPHNEALHRTLLYMYYLNDVAEGGETDFFYQQRSIQPKAGRMVIAPAYFTHTHRGRVPVSNDKYILTSWVLLQRAETLYGPPR